MNEFLITNIESLSSIGIFEDSISEDHLKEIEKETSGYNYFIYQTSGFSLSEDKTVYHQEVLLRFYSENRDDLDEFSLDIIDAVEKSGKLYTFLYSDKTSIQKGKEDVYIDEIEFYFRRSFLRECRLESE